MNQMLDSNSTELERYLSDEEQQERRREIMADQIEMRAKERLCVAVGKGDMFANELLGSEGFTPGDFVLAGTHMSRYYANTNEFKKDLALRDLGKLMVDAAERHGLQICTEEAEKELL